VEQPGLVLIGGWRRFGDRQQVGLRAAWRTHEFPTLHLELAGDDLLEATILIDGRRQTPSHVHLADESPGLDDLGIEGSTRPRPAGWHPWRGRRRGGKRLEDKPEPRPDGPFSRIEVHDARNVNDR